MFEFVARWWCRNFHEEVFRPVRGQYRCQECLREWPVSWEGENVRPADSVGTLSVAGYPAIQSEWR